MDNSALEAYVESQKPIWHRTVDLGIRKIKREIRRINPLADKSTINKFISAYKNRAWMEAEGVMRGRGSIPTYRKRGKSIKVEMPGIGVEHEVKINNG